MSRKSRLAAAQAILVDLGLPRAQQNERTALCLLAMLNLTPDKLWKAAESPRIGITPIMDWARKHYKKPYAPNRYKTRLQEHLSVHKTLAAMYANERAMAMIPLKIKEGVEISLSAGDHSLLIKAIVEEFAPRFVSGSTLLYVGDTGDKYGFFDVGLLAKLGVVLDSHGKLPDVVIYNPKKNWLFLIESVTSHGPVDSKRHRELEALFATCSAGRVYVSAFPNRKIFMRYLEGIAWETEVWIASAPSHMVHFNGPRFLGPYENS
jgi:hypothetical protein